MGRILFISFNRKLKSRLNRKTPRSSSQILCYSIILIAVFQLLALKVDGRSLILNESISSTEQGIRELKPGETITRQIETNERQFHTFRLDAGQSVTLTIPNHSTALAIRVFSPDNQVQSHHQQGAEIFIEPIVIVAEKSGDYRINVYAFWSGNYSISCGIPHKTTERDLKYDKAQQFLLKYVRLVQADETANEEGRRKILETIESAVSAYRDVNEPKGFIAVVTRSAEVLIQFGEFTKAFNAYSEALEHSQPLNNIPQTLFILSQLGRISVQLGNYQGAIDYCNQGLNLSRTISSKTQEALFLTQLGNISTIFEDKQKALEFYEQSVAVNRTIDPPSLDSMDIQAQTLNHIGNINRGVDDSGKTLESFNNQTETDRLKAVEYYQQSLEIYKSLQNSTGNGTAFLGEALMLLKIGDTYREMGKYAEALEYLTRSLEKHKELEVKWRNRVEKGQAGVLKSLGQIYLIKNDYKKAFDYNEQAIALLQSGFQTASQADFLNSMGKNYYQAGETQKAIDLLDHSLTLSRAREQHDVSAASLYEIARIERDLGNFANARNRIEEAIEIVESIRAKLAVKELRASYFATVKRYYDFYIDLLMQAHKSQPEKGFDALALQTSEKARSRSLLDLLSQARVDIKQGVDGALLEREQQARERLIEKAYQQNRLLLGKHTKEEAEKAKTEVSNLTNEYEAVQSEIRNKSPRYAALTQPTSLNAKQIQQLLDSGTILLEYSLGEKKSYLWVVTNDSVTNFDLPKREEIEAQARRVYELLTVRNENLKGETDAQRLIRIKLAEEKYPKAAEKLTQMLLAPVVSRIGNKRLLIVPDGALNYIPFSVLPSPKAAETANWPQTLGINHEIVTLPSASILALLREETQNRKPAPKMLAVFADPVFSQMDIRANSSIAARTIEKTAFSRDFERAVSDVGLRSGEAGGLPRLPFSRREANSIFRVSPKNLSLKQVDFEASKAEVFDSNLDQYRILHFATHGLLNSQHPELSGIVLSLIDKKGDNIDGFVRLQDIYNLKLSADLVVLSACNTALGKDVKGEGLIGLTRGFMYAGSPRIVASLWKVDDAATAEFMSIFYRKMLTENLRPAAGLRAAQAEMMKQTRWRSPYYWAPFIIQGEWK